MESPGETLQVFRVGARQFAIKASDIATIADWRQPTPLPHAPASVLGVVSLQGRMLTVLDVAKISEPENANGSPAHIIALRGDEQLALAADQISEKIGSKPAEKADGSGFSLGFIEHHGQQVELVNVQGLFSAAIQGRERRQRRF